jgi:hypothetical protein
MRRGARVETVDGRKVPLAATHFLRVHGSLPPGRYACELIKGDSGQWRFSHRTVFHDHDYTLDGIGR